MDHGIQRLMQKRGRLLNHKKKSADALYEISADFHCKEPPAMLVRGEEL